VGNTLLKGINGGSYRRNRAARRRLGEAVKIRKSRIVSERNKGRSESHSQEWGKGGACFFEWKPMRGTNGVGQRNRSDTEKNLVPSGNAITAGMEKEGAPLC